VGLASDGDGSLLPLGGGAYLPFQLALVRLLRSAFVEPPGNRWTPGSAFLADYKGTDGITNSRANV
jgi:hypothetical protein